MINTFTITLVLVILINQIAGVLFFAGHFKYYKRRYKMLPSMQFRRSNDVVFGYKDRKTLTGFRWYADDNSFLVADKVWLFSSFFLNFINPYGFYWRMKYKRWCKKNIDLEKIEMF